MPRSRTLAVAAATLVLFAAGCADDSSSGDGADTTKASDATTAAPETTSTTVAVGPARSLVFSGQGNNLDVYATEPSADGTFETQRVYETIETDSVNGRDINAQICLLPPTDDGEQWFIAGEDTGQADPNRPPGWGIFRLEGHDLGELKATQIGKLVPTFQPANDNPENYGCGVLPDGRVFTTDVGNQASGTGDGQLIIWFPPITGGTYPDLAKVAYCKLDVTLPTAQSMLVRGEDVYVAAARGDVYKYSGPFPTGPDAAGGCGKQDATGAPMADTVNKSSFIKAGDNGVATPAGLANAPDDGFYVSSVFTGVIGEFGPDGAFRRQILAPPAGEVLGEKPYSTGTPLGIGVDAEGTLFYADIGIVVGSDGVGPGENTGTVRQIRFVNGEPQPPVIMAGPGLAFPDGIGVWNPAGS
jgi:hypothetical protein